MQTAGNKEDAQSEANSSFYANDIQRTQESYPPDSPLSPLKTKFGLKVHATFGPAQADSSGSGVIKVEENGADRVNNPSETDIQMPGAKVGSMNSIQERWNESVEEADSLLSKEPPAIQNYLRIFKQRLDMLENEVNRQR